MVVGEDSGLTPSPGCCCLGPSQTPLLALWPGASTRCPPALTPRLWTTCFWDAPHSLHHMKPLCPPLPIPAWELPPEAVGGTAEGLGECRGPGGLRRARGSWRRWSRKHMDQETRTQTEKARGWGGRLAEQDV